MVKNQRNSCCHMGCPPMIGDLHFHRGYSLRLQESKPLKNNGIISTTFWCMVSAIAKWTSRMMPLVCVLGFGTSFCRIEEQVYFMKGRKQPIIPDWGEGL